MSHTLHRQANKAGLKDDYVILIMANRPYTAEFATTAMFRHCLEIMLRHNPVNMGGSGIGHLCNSTPEKILEAVDKMAPQLPMIHGVFATREDLVGALREIKEADYGLSVIVSGLVDSTDCCVREAGLKRHSLNYSLGVWGNTDDLPDERILQISTMCGHGMISFNLISKAVEDIKAGKITAEEAAVELAKPCLCGIFNPVRAQRLLEELL
jgi:hypothetical protein